MCQQSRKGQTQNSPASNFKECSFMRRLLCVVSIVVFFITTGIGLAADAKTPEQKSGQDIRKLLTEMEESFNRRDAKGLALCWTSHGDFVGQNGERVEGRENIEKGFRESFAAREDSRLQLLVLSLRVIGEGFALVDAIAVVKPQATITAGEPTFQLVLVKRDDRWLIETARETISRVSREPQQLKELEWMVGDWTDDGTRESGVSVHSTCDWTIGDKYLIRKFSAEGKDGLVRGGTEVIGWDPRTHRIRSWMFDSDGSFGESVWARDEDRWIVKHSGTLADGSDASVTHIITPVDADTVTVQSKDHSVNGEKQPDLPEVKLKRSPAPAETKSKPSEPAKLPRHVLP
jgi:uncharacterized protein (TIGR02246 family)